MRNECIIIWHTCSMSGTTGMVVPCPSFQSSKTENDDEPTMEHVYDVLHDPVSRHVIVPVPALRVYPVSHD